MGAKESSNHLSNKESKKGIRIKGIHNSVWNTINYIILFVHMAFMTTRKT